MVQMGSNGEIEQAFQYDVCLSFAGEDRTAVEEVANGLVGRGVRVFYDRYKVVELWGTDLYEHLDYVYSKAARFCVLFVSAAYAEKVWTTHERKSAQARALAEHSAYILPVRIDDTEIPGLRPTVGFVDMREVGVARLVDLIDEKLGPRPRVAFLPPTLDRLYEVLGVEPGETERVYEHASSFFNTLRRMSQLERDVVIHILLTGCPAEMPSNVHASIDLLRRELTCPASQIVDVLSGIGSLGFKSHIREHPSDGDGHALASAYPIAVLTWRNMTVGEDELYDGEAMVIAQRMLMLVGENSCPDCTDRALQALNFGDLAIATAESEDGPRQA